MDDTIHGEEIDRILTKHIQRPRNNNLLIIFGTLCIAAVSKKLQIYFITR